MSRLRHTFFFENFREREARNAKPEGAKRPSSPAGLARRSASRACKLVLIYFLCVDNVIQLANISFTVQIYIVMEHAGHGDLLEYIKLRGVIPEEKCRFMFGQLVSAVQYLHSSMIAHR